MIVIDDTLLAKIEALPISELIIKYYPAIQLRPNNTVYIGLCPFHKENEPSFTVFNNNGIESFYCYGCHAGNYKETQISSNIIGFYMAIEKVDFKIACERLCNIFGIQYNMTHQDAEIVKLRHNAYKNNEIYFQTLIANQNAVKYLANRGLTKNSIRCWQLGLVPPDDYMFTHRNRLAIPLIDTNDTINNVCGFAYRSLEENDNVKYRNDSNNRIFNKKRFLYGLPQAMSTIRQTNAAIIVEGYFDVMLMHQCGIVNTVGLMGTSFTSEQMSALQKYTNRIFMLTDGDKAGVNALNTIVPMLYQNGFKVFVCTPPQGMDAADMCNHFGHVLN